MRGFRIAPDPRYKCSVCKEKPGTIVPNVVDPKQPGTNTYSGTDRICDDCAATMGIDLPPADDSSNPFTGA